MFLAESLPTLTPLTAVIYPHSPDMTCRQQPRSGLGINPRSLSRKNILRFFSAGIDTEGPGRTVRYWLPGVKFRSRIPPKTHHFPDWMTFLLSYLHTCHLQSIVVEQASVCSSVDTESTDIDTFNLVLRNVFVKQNLLGESPAKECKQLKGFYSFEGYKVLIAL